MRATQEPGRLADHLARLEPAEARSDYLLRHRAWREQADQWGVEEWQSTQNARRVMSQLKLKSREGLKELLESSPRL